MSSPPFITETKAEALDLIRDWVRDGGFDPKPDSLLVGKYVTDWWKAAKRGYQPNTIQSEENRLNKYVHADLVLCNIELTALTKADVKAWLSRMPEKTSENTKAVALQLLARALSAAVQDEVIPKNPALNLSNPPKKAKARVPAFTPDSELRLIAYSETSILLGPLVRFAFDSGCRQAEVFGLQFGDIDFDLREVRIRRTTDTIQNKPVTKELLKTDSSFRTITVSKSTIGELERLLGAGKPQNAHIFTNPEGGLWDRNRFRPVWGALVKNAGVESLGFNSCRHSCATRLLRGGGYIVAVSKRLGHASAKMTLDKYSDAIPSDQQKLADAFDDTMTAYRSSPKFAAVQQNRCKIGERPATAQEMEQRAA